MRLAIPAATIGVMSIAATAFAGDRPLRPAGPSRDASHSEPVIRPPAWIPSSRGHAVSAQVSSTDRHAAEFLRPFFSTRHISPKTALERRTRNALLRDASQSKRGPKGGSATPDRKPPGHGKGSPPMTSVVVPRHDERHAGSRIRLHTVSWLMMSTGRPPSSQDQG
jgi:hypothetical protein